MARAAWAIAARTAIESAAGYNAAISAPVYLGDALQLRYQSPDLITANTITIETDKDGPQLVFPIGLVDRADDFDAFMYQVSTEIEEGHDPLIALDDNGAFMTGTTAKFSGRNHRHAATVAQRR